MRCTRCTGSAPLSGSSSTSTGGSVTRAAATLARWRIPLLNPARRRSAARQHVDRVQGPLGGPRVAHAVEVGHVAHQLAGGQPGGDGLVLRHQGDAPVDARGRCGGRAPRPAPVPRSRRSAR